MYKSIDDEKWFVPVVKDGQLETLVINTFDYYHSWIDLAHDVLDEIQLKKIEDNIGKKIQSEIAKGKIIDK